MTHRPADEAKTEPICDLIHAHCGACGCAIARDGGCNCADNRVHPVGKLDADLRSKYIMELAAIRQCETSDLPTIAELEGSVSALTAERDELKAENANLREEAAWIRRKLDLPEDAQFVSGDGKTVAGAMNVVCSAAHGYNTYIVAYKCNDKQGEIARLTVERDELKAALAKKCEDYEQLTADIRERARELCPDYPWTLNTPHEDLWALTESLRGVSAANDDVHKMLSEVMELLASDPASGISRIIANAEHPFGITPECHQFIKDWTARRDVVLKARTK